MKKLFLLLLLAGFALPASAQDDDPKPVRKRFFNVSYISDKIKPTTGDIELGSLGEEIEDIANDNIKGLKNNWGIALTSGRTYSLHGKPLARLVTIGIDASFFDVSYSNYSVGWALNDSFLEGEGALLEERKFHKFEYSLQVGPSVPVTPGRDLTVAAYVRFAPSFTAYYVDKSMGGNYMSMLVTGASASFRSFGAGIEARLGSCKYRNFKGDLDLSATKIKTSGFRVYLQYRW